MAKEETEQQKRVDLSDLHNMGDDDLIAEAEKHSGGQAVNNRAEAMVVMTEYRTNQLSNRADVGLSDKAPKPTTEDDIED